jgi:hypothetical protein
MNAILQLYIRFLRLNGKLAKNHQYTGYFGMGFTKKY